MTGHSANITRVAAHIMGNHYHKQAFTVNHMAMSVVQREMSSAVSSGGLPSAPLTSTAMMSRRRDI